MIITLSVKKYCDSHKIKFAVGSEQNQQKLDFHKQNRQSIGEFKDYAKLGKKFGEQNKETLGYFCEKNNITFLAGDPKQQRKPKTEPEIEEEKQQIEKRNELIDKYLHGKITQQELSKQLPKDEKGNIDPYIWNITKQGIEERNEGMLSAANEFSKSGEKTFYLMFVGNAHLVKNYPFLDIDKINEKKPNTKTESIEQLYSEKMEKNEETYNFSLAQDFDSKKGISNIQTKIFDLTYDFIAENSQHKSEEHTPDEGFNCLVTFYEVLNKQIEIEKKKELELEKSKQAKNTSGFTK